MVETPHPDSTPNQTEGPDSSVFSAGQVAATAFFFGPIAPSWLMYRNLQSIGGDRDPRNALKVGLVVTIVVAVAAMLLPTEFPNMLIPGILVGLASYWYKRSFEKDFDAHIDRGGRVASSWRATKVGVVSFFVTLVFFVPFALFTPLRPINSIAFDTNIVYYEGGAERQDAERLGQALNENGFFDAESYIEVTIVFPRARQDIVIVEAAIDVQPVVSQSYVYLDELARTLEHMFVGKKLEIHVVGLMGQTQQTFPAPSDT